MAITLTPNDLATEFLHPSVFPSSMFEHDPADDYVPLVGHRLVYAGHTGIIYSIYEYEDGQVRARVSWEDGDTTSHDTADFVEDADEQWELID